MLSTDVYPVPNFNNFLYISSLNVTLAFADAAFENLAYKILHEYLTANNIAIITIAVNSDILPHTLKLIIAEKIL